MPIDCLVHIKGNDQLESYFKGVKTKGEAIDLARNYHEILHKELEDFKKSIDPKYTKKPFVKADNSKQIEEIKSNYQKKIDEAIRLDDKRKSDEDIVSVAVNVAPLFSTKVDNQAQAAQLHNSPFYKGFKERVNTIAGGFGLAVVRQDDVVGAYNGTTEVTNVVTVRGKFSDVVKFAATFGALTPEVQDSTIASMYVEAGSEKHNADRVGVGIDNVMAAKMAAKDAGFDQAGYTLLDDEISFFNVFDYPVDDFDGKIDTFESKYQEYGGKILSEDRQALRFKYIDAGERQDIITETEGETLRQQQGGAGFRDAMAEAKERNQNFLIWRELNSSPVVEEYRVLRQKQLDLDQKGESLSVTEAKKIKELEAEILTPLASIISSDENRFESAKAEIEAIAGHLSQIISGAFKSEFGIKRPERAAIKVIRWYDSQPNNIGDGARTNIIVNTDGDADLVFSEATKLYGTQNDRTEYENTDLGYPKRLIEIRTSNGKISELQVMTPQGYLAKDGVKYFPDDAKGKAAESLKEVRKRLGWDIPDGVGHYFYEIHRDVNIDKKLRTQAEPVSKMYYDAFLNPDSKVTKEEFYNAVSAFKNNVDSADKSEWDKGNEGKSPAELDAFLANTKKEGGGDILERAEVTKEAEALFVELKSIDKIVGAKNRAMAIEALYSGEQAKYTKGMVDKAIAVNKDYDRIVRGMEESGLITEECTI